MGGQWIPRTPSQRTSSLLFRTDEMISRFCFDHRRWSRRLVVSSQDQALRLRLFGDFTPRLRRHGMSATITSGRPFQAGESLSSAHIAHDMGTNGFASIDILDSFGRQIIIVIDEGKRRPVQRRCGRARLGYWTQSLSKGTFNGRGLDESPNCLAGSGDGCS